jgi:hypothetical protein
VENTHFCFIEDHSAKKEEPCSANHKSLNLMNEECLILKN